MNDTTRKLLRWLKYALLTGVAVIVLLVAAAGAKHTYEFWDADAERGAIAMPAPDHLGDQYDKVVYLPQGWDEADSLWFYNTTQGSDLMPYDFFLVLEQPDSQTLFRDNENINRYRYLVQKATHSNPDGLPVGFVLDSYKGKNYVGLTCAACHTGQVNFQGTAMRIDGGPAGSDMETFMEDAARALTTTLADDDKRARFVAAVLARGNYDDEQQVLADLKRFAVRLKTYAVVNRPTTPYRYGRLDAFGRIYNRVLEHVMSGEQLREILARQLSPADLQTVMAEAEQVLSADHRDNIVVRIASLLTVKQQLRLRNEIFNSPNAPVSYPFLWDIPKHDYVQWNGLGANAGIGPLGRNAGEVIGVFGTLDWRQQKHRTLSTILGGQSGGETTINFESSVDVHNLRRIEHHLHSLQSPQWPEDLLGEIDRERAGRGNALYARYCISCHDEIERANPERRVIAELTGVDVVGTDPKMAHNSSAYDGYSGILRNQYVSVGVGDVLLQRSAPVAALLTKADINVVTTPDPDKWRIRSWMERLYDFAVTFFDNDIKSSIKQGTYDPDTSVAPFASLAAYKARPLNGIWATAPYLHNGSVPSLLDLFFPAKREGDPDDGDYRPVTFNVGSREFDPYRVGLRTDDGDNFDTRLRGNSNSGHEYAAGRTPQKDGNILPALSQEQRLDLLEYLKTL